MSSYIKGVNTAAGIMPFFPPDTEIGMVWGVLEDGSWGPVAAGSGGSVAGAVRLIPSATFRVGENLLLNSPVTLGAGWTGSLAEGFTHTAGNTEPLTFDIGSADGEAFIIEGGCPHTGSVLLELKIGQSYPSDPYNGTERICWGVQSVGGGSLVILPKSSFAGTLTDLSCRKVDDSGTNTVTLIRDDIGHTLPEDYLGGMWNIQLGQGALASMVNATRNVAIGRNALQKLVTGSRNVALGTFTLPKVEYADSNVNIGSDSGLAVKTAEHCVAVGRGSMYNGAAPAKNVAIGSHALNGKKTSGQVADTDVSDSNVAVGYRASFYSGADQERNVAIGADAMLGNGLPADAVQTDNVLIGAKAGYNGNASKSNNVAIGADAMLGNGLPADSVQTDNVLIGAKAGYNGNASKSNNVAIGVEAMYGNGLPADAVQTDNVLIGEKAGYKGCQAQIKNTVVGAEAMYGAGLPDESEAQTTQQQNVFMGYRAGYNGFLSLENNVGIGYEALMGDGATNRAKLRNSVGVGYQAGHKNQSVGNVFLGYKAGFRNINGNNNVFIGNNAVPYCGSSCNTVVGAGTSIPQNLDGNIILIGFGAAATKKNQAVIGCLPTNENGNGIKETVLMGDLINVDVNGVKRKIVFVEETDANGNTIKTCRWEEV